MMHTTQTLYDNLGNTLLEINKMIDAVTKDAQKHIETLPYPEETTIYQIKRRDGQPVLAELTVAKAQCLSAMANLKVASGAKR